MYPGEPEGLELGWVAGGVLAEEDEVAGVGDEDEAVLVPVAADLVAIGGEPCVVGGGFYLDDATFGELAIAGLSALHLPGGVESEVGAARAYVLELADAADPGLEGGADGGEEVVEGGVVGELAGCAAGRADAVQVGEVGLYGGCELGCGHGA